MADPDIPLGGHEMRLNDKGTVGTFGRRKLIYNKIITRLIWGGGAETPAPFALATMGTVGSFGGRKLIYTQIITRLI